MIFVDFNRFSQFSFWLKLLLRARPDLGESSLCRPFMGPTHAGTFLNHVSVQCFGTVGGEQRHCTPHVGVLGWAEKFIFYLKNCFLHYRP